MTGRRVVERRRNRMLHVHHVVVRSAIDRARRDAWLDERRQVIEELGSQASCLAHARDLGVGFDFDRH